jgi:acyl-CoA synthetase (AMP-forming)/AMP-acid ligase II
MALFPQGRFHQCLWPDRDQLDHLPARSGRAPRGAAASDPAIRPASARSASPLPTVELEIRDEAGRRCRPASRRRDLCARRAGLGRVSANGQQLDAEGWFPTRDSRLARRGGLSVPLDGRADDVIVRGGENISPGEIEDVLLAHPAIAEAAAVGIPSVEWGEAIGVVLVVKTGP